MKKTAVIIPNYNGLRFIRECLMSLRRQSTDDFSVVVVDNGSEDGSDTIVETEFPEVLLVRMGENTGFTGAVNAGLRASSGAQYALLLNNDTVAGKHFVEQLVLAMDREPDVFSAQAKMLRMDEPDKMDDAGDYYTLMGWAFGRGRGKPAKRFRRGADLFFSCAGAAIYRMSFLRETGFLDEPMFAYLEDCDLGWRARLSGYRNIFVPSAQVLHAGSGSSGSRYNAFKVRYSSRNSVYIIRKNMHPLQIVINLPFLFAGFAVKTAFFLLRGLGGIYIKGLFQGLTMPCSPKRYPMRRYFEVQLDFLKGTVLFLREFLN